MNKMTITDDKENNNMLLDEIRRSVNTIKTWVSFFGILTILRSMGAIIYFIFFIFFIKY